MSARSQCASTCGSHASREASEGWATRPPALSIAPWRGRLRPAHTVDRVIRIVRIQRAVRVHGIIRIPQAVGVHRIVRIQQAVRVHRIVWIPRAVRVHRIVRIPRAVRAQNAP